MLAGSIYQSLNRHSQFPQKSTDGWPALGKLVFDFKLDNISRQSLKSEFLQNVTKCDIRISLKQTMKPAKNSAGKNMLIRKEERLLKMNYV